MKKFLSYSSNQNATSLFLFGSRVISPTNTTQNGKISVVLILPISLYALSNPGVNNLHNLSCAFPRPALGSLPSTQPSWRFISPKRILPVCLFSIAKSGDTPHFAVSIRIGGLYIWLTT